MTQTISSDDMNNVRQSLAQAGIYFDKLYINQAYFNSNFTIQTSNKKTKKSSKSFWQKLLCGSAKQSSTGTQTALTVRDESDIQPPPLVRRQRMPPTENLYDRRRSRPVNPEYIRNNNPQSIRRRRSLLATRTKLMQRPKLMNDNTDEDYDAFAV